MKFKLEKRELLYAFTGAFIIILWFLLLKDLISPYLLSIAPIASVLVYHAGFYIGVILLSKLLVNNKIRLKFSLITISIAAGIDLIDTPYILSKSGVVNKSIEYWFTTYDSLFYGIYSQFTHGELLWWLVYPVSGIILIIILPILISNPRAIWKAITK